MFEKEAKRSFDELDDRGVGDDWSIEESYINGFSNGAEFGYNKATKWYYPSKGEYPRKEALYLCQWQDGEITVDRIYIDGNGEPYFAGSVTFADIIAWKELPEPPKEI